MRLSLTFLLLLLTVLTTPASSKVVSGGEKTVTKEILSFTVSSNPEVFTARVVEKFKTKKLKSSPQPSGVVSASSKTLNAALRLLIVFLAVIGMWSSLKTLIITIATLGRTGFGMKTIAGVIVFMMSLAMLFYALHLAG